MGTFIEYIFNPVLTFWLLLLSSLLLFFFKRIRIAKIFFVIGLLWLFIVSVSPVPLWLTKNLEGKFTVFKTDNFKSNRPVHILVLGGGHTIAPGFTHADQLSFYALGRLAEAIRIHKKIPGSKIVCSGFSVSGGTTQAEMLAMTALDLGISPADTLMMKMPGNTSAEAKAYTERFGNNYTLIVVSDAFHLPRAMGLFQQNGLRPIPAPANHFVKNDRKYLFFPSAVRIELFGRSMHEYIGIWFGR